MLFIARGISQKPYSLPDNDNRGGAIARNYIDRIIDISLLRVPYARSDARSPEFAGYSRRLTRAYSLARQVLREH